MVKVELNKQEIDLIGIALTKLFDWNYSNELINLHSKFLALKYKKVD